MKRFSPIARISVGLTSLTATLVLIAATLGLVPDQRGVELEKRRALAEALAINCSLFASQDDTRSIKTSLQQTVARNPDVIAARVQRPDGSFVVNVSPAAPGDGQEPAIHTREMRIAVPIVAGKRRWGAVQLDFHPLDAQGIKAILGHPLSGLMVFVSCASFVVFYFYMRATLQYLDPSKVMPERVRQTLDTLTEGLMVLDKRERIVHTNESFARLTGQNGDDLRGQRASNLPWHAAEGDPVTCYPWTRAVESATFETGAKLGLDVQGRGRRTFLVNTSSITDDKRQTTGALVSLDDVTELEASRLEMRTMLDKLKRSRDEIQRQNRELEQIARVDPLTSCLNRRVFYADFEVQWHLAQRHGRQLSCAMVDIDHFKLVNDQHGHSTGDTVLQVVSRVLRQTVRGSDLVCRYGGEEFCVLLPETDIDGACLLMERIREAIELTDCDLVRVTASIGISTMSLGAHDPRELLDQADKALYAAKRGGRNQAVRFDHIPEEIKLEDSQPPGHEPVSKCDAMNEVSFPIVSALLSVMSFRDADTAAHCQRVADLCSRVAKDLMSPSEAYLLEVGALLHDIGKIGVPDSVLLKRASLTEDEWKIMRKHEQIGVAIVEETFGVPELTNLIGSHHAWYDGNPDHPDARVGDNIPLAARILSIAEAYDCMVSDSVYRQAMSSDQAFEELRKGAGQQFDPALVEHCITEVQAQDTQRRHVAGMISKDAATGIGRCAQELTKAIENRDTCGLAAIAQQIRRIAEQHGAPELENAAQELLLLATEDTALIEIASSVSGLLDLCRDFQGSYLTASTNRISPTVDATDHLSGMAETTAAVN